MVTTRSLAESCSPDKNMAGNILSFHIFGKVIVVLNTAKAAKDLLEKRGAIYSDRTVLPFYEMWVLESFTRAALAHNEDQDGVGLGYAS